LPHRVPLNCARIAALKFHLKIIAINRRKIAQSRSQRDAIGAIKKCKYASKLERFTVDKAKIKNMKRRVSDR
jgi:nickel-dependent lactate racemase